MEMDVNPEGKAKMATTIELKSSTQRFMRGSMAEDTNIMSEPSKMSLPPPAATTDSYSSISASLDKLTAEVTQLRQVIKEKDDVISQLNEHILYIETEAPSHNKKRKFSSSAQVDDEDEGMDNLRIENEQLKERIDELERSKTATVITNNQIETTQENTSTTTGSPKDIMKMIEEKLSTGLSKIEENVNLLIETKLNKLPPVTNDAIPTDTVKATYAAASAGSKNHVSGNLRNIMMTTKNEEITEQNERKRRAKNIIVFGKSEHMEQRLQKQEDEEFSNQLLKDIQVGSIKTKEVSRIGTYNRDDSKTRPLKISVETEEEQQKIMENLKNLKGNQDYKGISIKEDYTMSERQLIKEYIEQAKALNAKETAKETTNIYKVRGTPKNGLFLKRFTTTRETTEVSSL